MAMDWFRKAAEQEYAGAMLRLGWQYEKGEGFPQDFSRAYMWFNLAVALEANVYSRRMMVSERDGVAHKMTRADRACAGDGREVPAIKVQGLWVVT